MPTEHGAGATSFFHARCRYVFDDYCLCASTRTQRHESYAEMPKRYVVRQPRVYDEYRDNID